MIGEWFRVTPKHAKAVLSKNADLWNKGYQVWTPSKAEAEQRNRALYDHKNLRTDPQRLQKALEDAAYLRREISWR